MATANYNFNIDWFAPTSVAASSLEGTGTLALEGWSPFGTTPPTIALDTGHHYSGSQSLAITMKSYNPFTFDVAGHGFDQGKMGVDDASNSLSAFKFDVAGHGFDQGNFGSINDTSTYSPTLAYIAKDYSGLTIGQSYTITGWVLNLSVTPVQLGILGSATVSNTSTPSTSSWQQLTFTFTATATTHTLFFQPTVNPVNNEVVYLDYTQFIRANTDVTADALSRSELTWSYGRDWSSSLTSPIMAGQTSLELLNTSGTYMPTNPNSPLYGYIGPGKEVKVSATFDDHGTGLGLGPQNYPLFQGYIDDFQIDASTKAQSVQITAVDRVTKLSEKKLTTSLHMNLQTGDVVNLILDEIGWAPEKRAIDQGATTVRFWWLSDTTAITALQDIVRSEGDPAIFYINPSGIATFKSRHHRIPTPGAVGYILNHNTP